MLIALDRGPETDYRYAEQHVTFYPVNGENLAQLG